MDLDEDFNFKCSTQKKFYCPIHKKYDVEFVCELTGEFYCKQCLPKHKNH